MLLPLFHKWENTNLHFLGSWNLQRHYSVIISMLRPCPIGQGRSSTWGGKCHCGQWLRAGGLAVLSPAEPHRFWAPEWSTRPLQASLSSSANYRWLHMLHHFVRTQWNNVQKTLRTGSDLWKNQKTWKNQAIWKALILLAIEGRNWKAN